MSSSDVEEVVKTLEDKVKTLTQLNDDLSEKIVILTNEVIEEKNRRINAEVMLKNVMKEMEVIEKERKGWMERERQCLPEEEVDINAKDCRPLSLQIVSPNRCQYSRE